MACSPHYINRVIQNVADVTSMMNLFKTDSNSTVCSLLQAFVAMLFTLFSTIPCFDKRLRELKLKKGTN